MVLPAPVVVRSREEETGRAAGNLCQDQRLVPSMNVILQKGNRVTNECRQDNEKIGMERLPTGTGEVKAQ